MFAQTFLVVWRESIEALLVVGILHAWLNQNGAPGGAMRYLWAGVVAGLTAAAALSFALMRFGTLLPPEGQDWFQMALIFTACALVVQMVFWMRRHGRDLKRQLEEGLSERLRTGRLWGIFAIALIAVMREGIETVIFLQGVVAAAQGTGDRIAVGIMAAVIAATATFGVLRLGSRYLSWPLFFRLTETMLLFLACTLIVSGTGYLVSLGLLPYSDPVWDTSFLIDDTTRLGNAVAGLTGYRAAPDAITLSTWAAYWSGIAAMHWLQPRSPQTEAQQASI